MVKQTDNPIIIYRLTALKVIERLMLDRLRPHLLDLSNFVCLQLAYRRGHSTETALLHVIGPRLHCSQPTTKRQPRLSQFLALFLVFFRRLDILRINSKMKRARELIRGSFRDGP